MKAILFSAGLGTRLFPITEYKPKALVEIKEGLSVLEYNVHHLTQHGIDEIIVNIHHHPEAMFSAVKELKNKGFQIMISDEREQLLETGGALVKASKILSKDPFFIAYNVDVICNINLKKMVDFYESKQDCLAMLAIRDRNSSRSLLFNSKNELKGWANTSDGQSIFHESEASLTRKAFSGIHIIHRDIFKLLPTTGKFSITPHYIKLAKNHRISGFTHNDDFWFDIGKPKTLSDACQFFKDNPKLVK